LLAHPNSGVQGNNDPFDEIVGLCGLSAVDITEMDVLGFAQASTTSTVFSSPNPELKDPFAASVPRSVIREPSSGETCRDAALPWLFNDVELRASCTCVNCACVSWEYPSLGNAGESQGLVQPTVAPHGISSDFEVESLGGQLGQPAQTYADPGFEGQINANGATDYTFNVSSQGHVTIQPPTGRCEPTGRFSAEPLFAVAGAATA
jgi:hypothetical protein